MDISTQFSSFKIVISATSKNLSLKIFATSLFGKEAMGYKISY